MIRLHRRVPREHRARSRDDEDAVRAAADHVRQVATLLDRLVEELLVPLPRGDLGSQRVDQRAFRRRQLGGAVDGEDPDLVRLVADGGDVRGEPWARAHVRRRVRRTHLGLDGQVQTALGVVDAQPRFVPHGQFGPCRVDELLDEPEERLEVEVRVERTDEGPSGLVEGPHAVTFPSLLLFPLVLQPSSVGEEGQDDGCDQQGEAHRPRVPHEGGEHADREVPPGMEEVQTPGRTTTSRRGIPSTREMISATEISLMAK